MIEKFLNFIIHLDKYLPQLANQYGPITYLILFLIIFLETGLVFTPFLPGDSLLFITGTLASTNFLNIFFVLLILSLAAILGDSCNYWIGRTFGKQLVKKADGKFLKKEHLIRTHLFFEKHGGKTIILARFVPIVRTFAPFVAGVSKMSYRWFLTFNVLGGILWVFIFVNLGYFFGNLPIVKNNFHLSVGIIIFLSLIPMMIEWINHKRKPKIKEKIDFKKLEKILAQ